MTAVVEAVCRAAVRSGVTVSEVKSAQVRRRLATATPGGEAMTSHDWSAVARRLARASQRAAGGKATCSRCLAPVRWVLTAARGVRMPLDPLPTPAGNIALRAPSQSADLLAVVLKDPSAAAHGELLYRSHFATCPAPRAPRKPPLHAPTAVEIEEVEAERDHPMIVSMTIRETTWCTSPGCRWTSTGPAGDVPSGVVGDPDTSSQRAYWQHYLKEHHQ